ncbi:MAG: nucleotidyltransferase domain-containing protein [Opitutaceae bacterium]
MNHGLPELTVEKIHGVLSRHPQVDRAILYGSRAKGNSKPGSDIDLTLVGEGLSERIRAQISSSAKCPMRLRSASQPSAALRSTVAVLSLEIALAR